MLDRARVRDLYAEAADLPAEHVGAFLARECGTDTDLRREVESLLAASARRPAFLSAPTAAPGHFAIGSGEASGATIGRYRLREELGHGGFGSVYVGEQSEPVHRLVAVKIIKLGMDTRAVIARFEAERQALAMMDHEHIAKVFDAGATQSGRPYFVMELVKGEPITTYCDTKSLSIAERLGVFGQVCRAVQHAHSKGVIHRDIKPGNVLVSTQDGRPNAKVIDFGIAKATQHRLTEQTIATDARQFIGTPEYMSPEQADGSFNIDTRTDVYSLGVLLYELLTGATPFDPKALRSVAYGELQRIIREVEPPKPSTRVSTLGDVIAIVASQRCTDPGRLSPLLRGDLDWIVMRCLDKDRSRRYATSDALAADIEAFLRGDAVSAVPPSTGYLARKFIGRHRVAVFAGAAIGSALVLGAIGTTMGLVTAQREQRLAEAQRVIATREADQARAINDFMRHVLTSVQPGNRGADVRLISVLAEASASASERFSEHPLLEAEVRVLLGEVYASLSLWEPCEAEHRRAGVLYAQHAGGDDPRTLRAERQALSAAMNHGRTDEVEPAISALLPRLERVLGADDLATLAARLTLANVHAARGRLSEAESILLALRDHPRLTADDAMDSRILTALIRVYMKQPVIEDRSLRLAHWARVIPLARESIARALREHGPASDITLFARVHLAIALDEHEEFAAAAEVCRSVLADSSERLGDCHQARIEAMRRLAKALGRLGAVDEPTDWYLRAVACVRQVGGSDKIARLSGLSEVMHYLDRAGRAAEGEAIAREVAAGLAGFGGHASPFQAELYIASFASMAGRHDEAEGLFGRLLAQADASGESHARACANLVYARHLTRLGRFEESQECLERCAMLSGGVEHGTHDGLPDNIVFAFIELYSAWNKPDKVRDYRELREAVFGIPSQAAP